MDITIAIIIALTGAAITIEITRLCLLGIFKIIGTKKREG